MMLVNIAIGVLAVLSPSDKLAQIKSWVAEDGELGTLVAEWVESSAEEAHGRELAKKSFKDKLKESKKKLKKCEKKSEEKLTASEKELKKCEKSFKGASKKLEKCKNRKKAESPSSCPPRLPWLTPWPDSVVEEVTTVSPTTEEESEWPKEVTASCHRTCDLLPRYFIEPGAYLKYADLSGADLNGANLNGAFLWDA